MKRLILPFVMLLLFSSSINQLAAQEEWKSVSNEYTTTREPMPFLKAIGIPATATYDGKKLKAYVFLLGREKETGIGYPIMDVYIEDIEDLVPAKEYQQFIGPDLSNAVLKTDTIEITIKSKSEAHTITGGLSIGWSSFSDWTIPFGSEMFEAGPRSGTIAKSSWRQFVLYMSSGFDQGHLSIGGRVLSKRIEVDFSGKGIAPLLKDLIRVVGP